MPQTPPHAYCSAMIHEDMQRQGVDVVVTVRLPEPDRVHVRTRVCAHGITYWVYPSDGQLEEWRGIGMNP